MAEEGKGKNRNRNSTYRYKGDYDKAPLAVRNACPSVPVDSGNNILPGCCSTGPRRTVKVCSGQWPPGMAKRKGISDRNRLRTIFNYKDNSGWPVADNK